MLVELAIGDAYGAGFEYASPHFVERYNTLAGYVAHPRHNLRPGAYTDDTQMSLALAEAIISRDPWTPEHLAQRFVTAFKRDPREGYAQGFYKFLVAVQDGQDFLQRIQPHSDKSGAAMRAAPAGVFPTPAEVIEKSRVQAALTHNTPPGIDAAVVTALAAHYFIYNLGPKDTLGEFLEAHVPGPWSRPWEGKVGAKGWMSVRAALTALHRSDSMAALLKTCIAFTGDVDTVAAIALAIGACAAEISQDLPGHLYSGLEAGPFGYQYLADLDAQLMGLVTRPAD